MSKTSQAMQRAAEVAKIIALIEDEMKRIGYWRQEALPEEAYDFRQAFAMDTMAFPQWLQFILLPRVHQILAEHGEFPSESMVAAQAVREFDGDDTAAQLLSLLGSFDDLINKP
jgi:uncharacterized protein YqcC (DUF446 family)